MADSDWLTAEEATKYLGISLSTLYALSKTKKIPAHKIGKAWRYDATELDKWVKTDKKITEFFSNTPFNIDDNSYLREPQKEAYSRAYDFFAEGKTKAIVQLPVGCGKTGLVSILPFGIAKGRVLVIAPNLTIKNELKKALDITNKKYCFWNKCKVLSNENMTSGPYLAVLDIDSNIHDCDQSHIVLTNIQQLSSSADKWLPQFSDDYFDMILVDEGHHNAAESWTKVFEKFPNAKVVSLTATPFRSDQKEIEGEIIYKYSFRRAMIKGYIKKLQAVYITPDELYFTYEGRSEHLTLQQVLDLKDEEWFSKGVALSPVCNKSIVEASIDKLENLRLSGTHHQLIAVACSVSHARQIRSLYAERGYEAAEIYSEMPSDKQAEILQKLRSGILDCIIQVQMLGEGFDHPHLSVAAIFRPFRTLSPYIQFVGRIMRVVVQDRPGHPDNLGNIVTHVGMGMDKLLTDFRELDKEDSKFLQDLIGGKELEMPKEVLNGEGRQKLGEDMVVHNEIVDSFLQEEFIDPDDAILLEEMKAQAEALGFDPDELMLKKKKQLIEKKEFNVAPIIPQLQRKEARKRLFEEVKRAAKLLLNRLAYEPGGRDLTKLTGMNAANLVVAIQVINKEVNKVLEIGKGERNHLKTEDYNKGKDALESIINKLTRQYKKGEKTNGEKR